MLSGFCITFAATELLSGSAKRVPNRIALSLLAGLTNCYFLKVRKMWGLEQRLDDTYRTPFGHELCNRLRHAITLDAANRPELYKSLTAASAPPPPLERWRKYLPPFFPFTLINPQPKPPVLLEDGSVAPPHLPLWHRYRNGRGPFLYMTHERQTRLCNACNRYNERLARDQSEENATRAKCKALNLDAATESLVLFGLETKHKTRVWVWEDKEPITKPFSLRWVAMNHMT